MGTKSLEHAYEKLSAKLDLWLETLIEMLPNLAIALVVFIAFYFASKWISKYGNRALDRVSDNFVLNKLLARTLGIIVISAGVFFSLGLLHLDKTVTSLLAGIGIIGLAMSFAFQHTAANILGGIIISIRSTIDVGDLIRIGDVFGNVQRVGLRSTHILNVKGQHVDVPNRLFIDGPFKEYSQTGYRRIDVKGKVNFRENLDEVRQKTETAMAAFDFIYPKKKPNLVFNSLEDEKVDFTLRVWMNFTQNDGEFLNARSQCIIRLGELFKELNVEVARKEVLYIHPSK